MENQWKIVSVITLFKKHELNDNESKDNLWYWRLEYDGTYIAESTIGFDTEENAKRNAKHAQYVFSITDEKEFI
jgi:hypothetical protein